MDAKIVVDGMDEEIVETSEPSIGGETEGALALAEAPELEPAVTREQRRSRRKRAVRARTISVKRM
ncbi:MAG: sigma factor-like helix-turn-helix DNA-binding protein, partial [Polyangiaceae bacterium]